MQSNGISYLDLIIVIGLIIFLARGFKRGFTEEFIQMLGTIVSLILATRYMSNLSHYLVDPVGIPTIGAIVIAFAVIFLVTFFTFRYLATQMRKAVNVSVALGGIDKIVGAAFGLAKGAIFISLFVILLSFFEIFSFVSRYTKNSDLYHPMRRVAPLAYDALKVFVPQSKPFITELKDTTSGISYDKQGKTTRDMLDYYRKK